MTYRAISVSIDGDGIALVSINVPGQSMNVWDEVLLEDFSRFVDELNSDGSIRGAVIASGKPNAFLAGADLRMLTAMQGKNAAAMIDQAGKLSATLRRMETGGHSGLAIAKDGAMAKPVACAIGGLALGGGFELALACHYRVVASSRESQLGLPEVQLGLLPGAGGTQRTPRLVGLQAAATLCLQGKQVGPTEALKMGLVHEVAEPGNAVAVALEWVKANPAVLAPWDRKGFVIPGGGAASPANAQFFLAASAQALAQKRGNYPAAKAILSCLYEGCLLPIDQALAIEIKYFVSLLIDPVSANMIRSLFTNKLALERGAARPLSIPSARIDKIGVLGAGLMGSGITHVSAKAGMNVVVLDRSVEDAAKAVTYSRKIVDRNVERGTMTADEAARFLERIHPTDDYGELAEVDLIIEAVFEQPDVKADVIRRTEAVIRPDTIFASNTSTIPIGSLAAHSVRPEQFVGMHFFSPVERMPLLEIIPHARTGDRALAVAYDYNRRIRKTPIAVKDVRGFFTNQVFPRYVNECVLMVIEGIDPALIENCAKNLGLPIGPLALADETTLKLGYDVQRAAMQELGEDYVPDGTEDFYDLMVHRIERGGRRFGAGFYDYGAGGERLALWKGLADHFPRAAAQPSPAEAKQRILYAQLAPAAKCYAEGVVGDPESADIGALFGWGFPAWTGGPLSYIDTIGVGRFVAESATLAEKHGSRFQAPQKFKDLAAAAASLYGRAVG